MFILWIISTGALQFGYYGVSNWLPAYLESDLGIKFKEMAMYMVGTFLIMMFAKVIAGIVADKLDAALYLLSEPLVQPYLFQSLFI